MNTPTTNATELVTVYNENGVSTYSSMADYIKSTIESTPKIILMVTRESPETGNTGPTE